MSQVKEVQIELIEAREFHSERGSPPIIKVLELDLEVVSTDDAKKSLATTTSITTITTTTEDPVEVQNESAAEEKPGQEEEQEPRGVLEELSPTTDEYQEGLQFGSDPKDVVDDYESIDTDLQLGYIPPAPTPAPSLAPLAELDVDTVDDELCEPYPDPEPVPLVTAAATPTSSNEETRKRRKKRNSEGKKLSSQDDKDKEKAGGSSMEAADHNAVCPWEDELVIMMV